MFTLSFVLKSLIRNKIRILLTFLSIVFAFVLYGYVASIHAAFNGGVNASGADRLVMQNSISIINPIPLSYKNKIDALPFSELIASSVWFGGYFKETKNSFAQYAVDEPEDYLKIYPEIKLSEEGKTNWYADRSSAIIGKPLAEKYGWEVGDKITLTSGIWQNKQYANDWEFNIAGIFDTDTNGFSIDAMLFHYKYLNEGRLWGTDYVGWYLVKLHDADDVDIAIQTIDDFFKNSAFETKTYSEKAYMENFANRIGDFNMIFYTLVMLVIAILFLITGNTLSQSVRERINEYAVLNVLGFTNSRIIILVALEAFILVFSAGVIGIFISYLFVLGWGDPTGYFYHIYFPVSKVIFGLLLILALAFLANLFAVYHIFKLDKVKALRKAI